MALEDQVIEELREDWDAFIMDRQERQLNGPKGQQYEDVNKRIGALAEQIKGLLPLEHQGLVVVLSDTYSEEMSIMADHMYRAGFRDANLLRTMIEDMG